jgi:hypothetical protein
VLAGLVLAGTPAAAGADDNGIRLSAGGGPAARAVAGVTDGLLGAEVTLTAVPVVSVSTGLTAGRHGVAYAYGEVTLHFVASLGGGMGYGAFWPDGRRADGIAGHAFIGVPIPLDMRKIGEMTEARSHVWYVLPFYRPAWGPWPGAAHEWGLMLKHSYGLTGGRGVF